jgi:hypothetical protein
MNDRIDQLRRRIAAHRRGLANNPDLDFVRLVLSEIAADEAELARIEALANRKPNDSRE